MIKITKIFTLLISTSISLPAAADQLSLIRGDLNGDGTVNSADYTILLDALTHPAISTVADINGDGVVNSDDYLEFLHASTLGLTGPTRQQVQASIASSQRPTSLVKGDLNGDGVINSDDFNLMDQIYAATPHSPGLADLNGDGVVDATDYSIMDNNYNLGLTGATLQQVEAARVKLSLLPGDINGDGRVDQDDLGLLISAMGKPPAFSLADLNHDGVVNSADVQIFTNSKALGLTGPTLSEVIASQAPSSGAYANGLFTGGGAAGMAQIGLTQGVAASANYGYGIAIGIIDYTDGVDTSPFLAGRVWSGSNIASGWGNGGHGQEVADIAAGSNWDGAVGVAPMAEIIAEYPIAQTFIQAAIDGGASVVNVSLGVDFNDPNEMMVPASYASQHNATVVFAGGNGYGGAFNGGADVTGGPVVYERGVAYGGLHDDPSWRGQRVSQSSINNLIFVGSVNPDNTISSVSTVPGNASIVIDTCSTTASVSDACHANAQVTPVKNLWLVAPGSFTSFTAPQVTGAIALLEARWPVLAENNTASRVLFATATDLGAPGIDPIYGNGLLNIGKAFEPIGTLSVLQPNGKTVPVSNVTGTMIAGGALGSLSSISSQLGNVTTFDSFNRDFNISLSSLITTKPATSSAATSSLLATAVPVTSAVNFADGSTLAFGRMEQVDNFATNTINPETNRTQQSYSSFTTAAGDTMAVGYGFPAAASFSQAMWGPNHEAVSTAAYTLGVSNSLMGLAQGGMFSAYGMQMTPDTRIALSWSQTAKQDGGNSPQNSASANSINMGLTSQLTDTWTAGLTVGTLNEKNSLLGTTYTDSSPTNLGQNHQSLSIGASSAFALGDDTDLLIDAALVHTDGAKLNQGIISGVSAITARSYGVALAERNTLEQNDRMTLSLRKPLRVVSGTASLIPLTSTDGNGNSITTASRANLQPNGSETDLNLDYQAALSDNGKLQWNMNAGLRSDVDNIQGSNDAAVHLGFKYSF